MRVESAEHMAAVVWDILALWTSRASVATMLTTAGLAPTRWLSCWGRD